MKKEPIFKTHRLDSIGRIIVIEEDENSIWVYLMGPDEKSIGMDGFLCSVVEPVDLIDEDFRAKRIPPPLLKKYANEFSFNDSVDPDKLVIEFDEILFIDIIYEDELLLRMDIKCRKSYSKGLAIDGPYGNKLMRI